MSAQTTMQEVISSHNVIHVATIDGNGTPCVRALDFAGSDEENIIYIMTHNKSRKVEQIRQNSQVGFAIDRDSPSLEELANSKFIKGIAAAEIIEEPTEQKKAIELLMNKFPFLTELPYNPADLVAIRLKLQSVLVSDNTISFGHTEEINF